MQRTTFFLAVLPTIFLVPLAASANQRGLGLDEYMAMVIRQNETVQAQMFGAESARQRALAERGAFEPEWTGSAQHVRNRRPNTVEQERNLGGIPILDEKNNLYDTGIEALTITGAKVRLGHTLNNYNNNLRPFDVTDPTEQGRTNEWQNFTGATITQPLLKNAWTGATLANLRLAAINSAEAFQEYRRQLMVTCAQAEIAYWNLYFAQEQATFLDESVSVAEALGSDAREKVKAGKGTELDVLEAEAGLALRHTKRNDARQKYAEALGQLLVFTGQQPMSGLSYRATDSPTKRIPTPSYTASWSKALELNPDYLIQKKKLDEVLIRLGVARNQRLPELNLKGSYGYNGLGETAGESYSDASSLDFPSWSAGVEFRIPLGGGIRSRHELAALQATRMQVEKQTEAIETQLANAVNTAILKLRNALASAGDYRKMIKFNQDLLKTERERLALGKVEGHRVLEVEAGLFEVKQGLAEALVQTQRARLELQLAEGSTLEKHGLFVTPDSLRLQTTALLEAAKKPKPAPKRAKFSNSVSLRPEP